MRVVLTAIVRHGGTRRSYSSLRNFKAVEETTELDLQHFRQKYFEPGTPILLRGVFGNFPAINRWFVPGVNDTNERGLSLEYFDEFGQLPVPLEITQDVSSPREKQRFSRVDAPLSVFLQLCDPNNTIPARAYLAQCPLSDLPKALVQDVAVPELVTSVGRGDVYNSSIWLGQSPTYTPLHKDPNPNLFVQLAGTKAIRLMPPRDGLRIYETVRMRLGGGGNPDMRGDEMMAGIEAAELEKEIWSSDEHAAQAKEVEAEERNHIALEAHVHPGDGLFIPQGWWHSVKGVGKGMTGSVRSLIHRTDTMFVVQTYSLYR